MVGFTVRVELHSGTEEDYEKLHQAMGASGFVRTIVGKLGTYHLPPAEYRISSDKTSTAVCDQAAEAAATTGCTYAVLVTKGDDCAFVNLAKA